MFAEERDSPLLRELFYNCPTLAFGPLLEACGLDYLPGEFKGLAPKGDPTHDTTPPVRTFITKDVITLQPMQLGSIFPELLARSRRISAQLE